MKQFFFVLLLLVSISCKEKKLAAPENWVSDFENILSEKQEADLNFIISEFEKNTRNEIALITVENIGTSGSMKEHALKFGKEWGVGKKDENNGLIILFSSNLKQTFLATGYETEKYLTDEICKEIIDTTMIPHFKKGAYYDGLKAGLKDCMNKWR